jgi:hypothetical protein
MKRRIKRGLVYLGIGFVGLFCLRLAYGYLVPGTPLRPLVLDAGSALSAATMTAFGGRDAGLSKSNYASERLKVKRGDNLDLSVDQKYEKVASIDSKTGAFDDDERRVRDLAVKYNALIQYEQSHGLTGSRSVNLGIGVPPDRFDPMVAELKGIGELSRIQIDKTDKTNEYKEIKAKRASLEKTRDALVALKSKGGRIDEFTSLENRILEIEDQIQSNGVTLGEYDQENEFCTVKLLLVEKGVIQQAGISFRHRVAVALGWTIRYYAFALGILCAGTLLTLLLVVLLQRLNLIPPPIGDAKATA